MNVLFYRRANHAEIKGGDLVQLESTADGLIKQGVKADYSSDPGKDLSKYALVHIFNSPRFEETMSFMLNAKRQNKRVAFSTIFWPKDELAVGVSRNKSALASRAILGTRGSIKLRILITKLRALQPGTNEWLEKRLFREADILLPNSESEMSQITKTYGISKPYRVVRNAIDPSLFLKMPSEKREGYVLSAGRIESRKNTLELIEACYEAGKKLILIGGFDEADEYAKKCLKLIRKYGFEYKANLKQADLVKYLYEARVHAMASWYETPGLSSMEAACAGCRIVSTDRGSTREYFGDLALYCDPFNRDSIRAGIEKAWDSDFSLALRERILENYTWKGAAEDTLAAYGELLK